jgi:hypothetical protein
MKMQQDECSGPTALFLCIASSKGATPYIRKHRRRGPSLTQRIFLVVTPLQVATACYIVLYRRLQSQPVEAPTEASLPPPGASAAPTPVRLLPRTSENLTYEYFIDATSANRVSRKFTVASNPSGAAPSTPQRHGGIPLASKRADLVAGVAPLCSKGL